MVVESLLPTALTPNVSVDVEPLRQLFAPSNNETSPYALYAALIFAPLILTLAWDQLTGRKFPWAHPVFAYTPRWLSGIVWSLGSLDIMQKAYDKELSMLKDDVASNLFALEQDLNARFTGMGGFRNLHLHLSYVQKKINPNLLGLIPGIDKEIAQALAERLAPAAYGWQEVAVHQLLTTIAIRVSARLMLGENFSNSKEWLEIAGGFLQKLLESVTIFRFFPAWLHPLLYYIVPSRYATSGFKRRAEQMMRPVFAETLRAQATGHWMPSNIADGATWGVDHITDLAAPDQRTPDALVHAEILLIAASIPAMVATETNALFDLITRPDCLRFVQDEVKELSNSEAALTLQGLKSLHKLDSFLRESQRMNPAAMIGMRRIMKRDHLLKNGILLPKGAYVCCPVYVIQERDTEDPEVFDGLRSYKKRLNEQGDVDSQRHTFVSTEPTALAFGLGRSACPGRYMADTIIKLTLSKLVAEYDMKLPRGQLERPMNFKFHEFNLPSPFSTVMVQKRL